MLFNLEIYQDDDAPDAPDEGHLIAAYSNVDVTWTDQFRYAIAVDATGTTVATMHTLDDYPIIIEKDHILIHGIAVPGYKDQSTGDRKSEFGDWILQQCTKRR